MGTSADVDMPTTACSATPSCSGGIKGVVRPESTLLVPQAEAWVAAVDG